MPSPRPSPTGRGRKSAGWCSQPGAHPQGKGENLRSDTLTPALSHGEREKICGLVPSHRLSPTGRGRKPAVWCPHPGPLPRGEGEKPAGWCSQPGAHPQGKGENLRSDALTPALSHGEREENLRSGALTPALSHGEREENLRAALTPTLSPGERAGVRGSAYQHFHHYLTHLGRRSYRAQRLMHFARVEHHKIAFA